MANAKSFYAVLFCNHCQRRTYHMDQVCCRCNARTEGLKLILAEERGHSTPVLSIEDYVTRQALLHPEVSDEEDEAPRVRWINESSLDDDYPPTEYPPTQYPPDREDMIPFHQHDDEEC